MSRAPWALTATWLAFGATEAWAAPPLTSPLQVVALLRGAKPSDLPGVVKRVSEACRGPHRRALRDHPALVAEVRRRTRTGPVAARRAVLDTYRCFSPAPLRAVLAPLFTDASPELVAYAAEVAARTEDPKLVPALLAAVAERREACLGGGLDAAQVDVCVWLTYAPGACLGRASVDARRTAGQAAVAMLSSPYPKVREVAVETVAATRLKAHAADIDRLIEQEKRKRFAEPNDSSLLGRFAQRSRALARGE